LKTLSSTTKHIAVKASFKSGSMNLEYLICGEITPYLVLSLYSKIEEKCLSRLPSGISSKSKLELVVPPLSIIHVL